MDMNNRADRWSELAAGYCLASAVVLTSVLQLARGQEELPPPAPQLPGAKANQILIDHRPRIVILTNVSPNVWANVPMLGQLFNNAGHGPTGCEEMLQHLQAVRGHETPPAAYQPVIADHPIGPVDPAMALMVERIREALTSELGNNVMFRVTARAHAAELPGQLLEGQCNGTTCCEEMLNRISGDHLAGQPRAIEINVHVISPLPTTSNPPLPRVGFAPGALIDTRDVRNSSRRFKANLLSRVESQNGDSFVRLGCAACGLGECKCGSDEKCASEAVCGSECAAAACTATTCTSSTSATSANSECKCDNCKCCKHALAHDETKCGEEEANCGEDCGATLTMVVENAEHHDEFADYHPLKLMRHIAELMAEKAAAEAALEVRHEAHEELAEIYEAMAEVMADNAALDAKLIAAAEHRKLLERITDLATENARLKTQNELAAERIEMAKSSVALSLENEHLKTRLAELEQKHAAAEAARTAAKPSGDRESR
jgi:hypothetical protein